MDWLSAPTWTWLLAVIIYTATIVLLGKKLIVKLFREKIIDVRHQQRVSMFKSVPNRDGAIVFLGDSITEGGSWNELFDDADILNRGIGGDTTRGVLNRLDEVIRHQPSKLFLMIGTNDIGFGIDTETIAKNYEAILHAIIKGSPKTEIFVQSVLPVNLSSTSFLPHNNAGVLKLNQRINEICEKLNLRHIDLHLHFSDTNGNLKAELTNDGLHLLGSGYLLWKGLIEEHLKSQKSPNSIE